MSQTTEEENKVLVREAFDTLFNKRDYASAEKFWSPDYIQHSAHIAPGRDGLFDLVKGLPATLRHELELITAEGDVVIVRGRFSGHGLPSPWIVADFVLVQDGLLTEHWDIIQDEVSREASVSGLPMYGDTFPEER
jgi:predicted SnoaL-like aldol condensation-catalyzing enzyme